MKPPKLDPRTEADLIEQTEVLVRSWSGWNPGGGSVHDPGGTLIRVFARMASEAIERLNESPNRHFGSFLIRLGARPAPPRSARAPVVFTVLKSSSEDVLIPKDTRVAAKADGEHPSEAIYRTETELLAVRSALKSVVVDDPENRRRSVRTALASANGLGQWKVFEGDTLVDNSLYLSADSVFTREDADYICIHIFGGQGLDTLNWSGAQADVQFSVWSGEDWQSVGHSVSRLDPDRVTVRLGCPLPARPVEVAGQLATWIRLSATENLQSDANIPEVSSIQALVEPNAIRHIPEQATLDGRPIDLSKDFHPFGSQPKVNDAFYLSCKPVLNRPSGTRITIRATNSSLYSTPVTPSGDLTLQWEVHTSSGWVSVGTSSPTQVTGTGFSDTTEQLSKTGDVQLQLPQVAPIRHGGKENVWLRARIIAGNYGTPQTVASDESGTVTLLASTLTPPMLSRITLEANTTFEESTASSLMLSRGEESASLIEVPVPLFPLVEETQASLYLGFDPPLPNAAISLYFQVAPPNANEEFNFVTAPARVAWETLTETGWHALKVEDETLSFGRRGLIRFTAPYHPFQDRLFGDNAQWIRVRWSEGMWPTPPKLGRILLNATWVRNDREVFEVLGRSSGGPNQRFYLAEPPPLHGVDLKVDEGNGPVGWTEVLDFNASGPTDRHYALEPIHGIVVFGDSQQGHALPRGARITAKYITGGGSEGNRPPGTITELKRTLPFIESLFNPDEAAGGSDSETQQDLLQQETQLHRDRAVTLYDYANLSRKFSSDIARVTVVPPQFLRNTGISISPSNATGRGGWIQGVAPSAEAAGLDGAGSVRIIIVPRSGEARPTPTRGMCDELRAALEARTGGGLLIDVRGPTWVSVDVTAEIGAQSGSGSGLLDRVREQLDAFLHPVHGGTGKTGWPFGRYPHASDIQRFLAEVPGVAFVRHLTVACSPPLPLPEFRGVERDVQHGELTAREAAGALVHSGTHQLQLVEA